MSSGSSATRWTGAGLRIAASFLALGVAAGCMSQDGSSEPSKDKGCGKCSAEMASLGEEIVRIPGVSDLRQIRYTEKVALTTPATLTVVVSGPDEPRLRDAVAKMAWTSAVTPLEDLSVGVLAPGAEYVEYHDYGFKRDADTYSEKWGGRPGG